MEREHLDDQEAFTHLRRAARSSGRKLAEVAREVAAGQPLPRRRTSTQAEQPTSAARTLAKRPSDQPPEAGIGGHHMSCSPCASNLLSDGP
jgi:hypothetical protein